MPTGHASRTACLCVLLWYDVLRRAHDERRLEGEGRSMDRCNELCTKATTGTCAVCEAWAEADRFVRFWFKGGWVIDGICVLRQWWSPVPRTEVRHKDVVQEAHKQYSETLNKTMLTLLGVALFCLLATIGSPDKLLLAVA